MMIAAKCKIAVNVLLDIAAHTEKGYAISLSVVSKRLSISHSYLEHILSKLKAAGLIHSHRGPGGGYSLGRKVEDISVKDIVNATDDPSPPLNGLSAQLWVNLEAHMQNQMSLITLHHILAKTPIKIDPVLDSLGVKLLKVQKQQKEDKMPTKILANKSQLALGPNSVFSFGEFILQKECV